MKKNGFVVSIIFLIILMFQAQAVHADGEEEFDTDIKSLTDGQVRAAKLQAKRFRIGAESQNTAYTFYSYQFVVRAGWKKRYDEIQEILNGLGANHTLTVKEWNRLVKLVPQIDPVVQQSLALASRLNATQASVSTHQGEKMSQQNFPRRPPPLAILPQASTSLLSIISDRTEKLSMSEQNSPTFSPLSNSASSAR